MKYFFFLTSTVQGSAKDNSRNATSNICIYFVTTELSHFCPSLDRHCFQVTQGRGRNRSREGRGRKGICEDAACRGRKIATYPLTETLTTVGIKNF